eukprot:jgi/Tetstr1/440108/TSEL_028466.t1
MSSCDVGGAFDNHLPQGAPPGTPAHSTAAAGIGDVEEDKKPAEPAESADDLGMAWFSALSDELKTSCLMKMPVSQVASFAQVSRACESLVAEDQLWRGLVARDFEPAAHAPSAAPIMGQSWRKQYRRKHMLRGLHAVEWEPLPAGSSKSRPCAREGHSFAPHRGGAVLFGGWGGAIRNDVYRLDCAELERSGEVMWRSINARRGGDVPHVRYGHSLTACGDLLVAFGGMISGGYRNDLDDVAVLRPRPEDDELQPPGGGGMQFFQPVCEGPAPCARGYHSACASPDGTKLYIFGGISHGRGCNELAVLDVTTWTWTLPATHGELPSPRFGSAMAVYNNQLWVVGGGRGGDLLRSGPDVHDVHCLDLASLTWSKPALQGAPPSPECTGRECGFVLVGSKLLLFGGSLDFHNKLSYIDLEERRWGAPRLLSRPPSGRITGRMALVGDSVYMFGGWDPVRGELGDLYRLHLVASDEALDRAAKAQNQSPMMADEEEDEELRLRSMKREYQRIVQQLVFALMTGSREHVDELQEQLEQTSEAIRVLVLKLGVGASDSDGEAGSAEDGSDWEPTDDDSEDGGEGAVGDDSSSEAGDLSGGDDSASAGGADAVDDPDSEDNSAPENMG